jgi:large subunit ribosomal protein L10
VKRQEKEELVARLSQMFKDMDTAFLVEFSGLTVPDGQRLRKRVKEVSGGYQVIKNRLAIRAIPGTPLEPLKDHFRGTTAVTYVSDDDPIKLARVLLGFAKETPVIAFKAGLVEGRPVDAFEIKQIASLPSREVIIGRLIYLLKSPLIRLVTVLSAPRRELVTALDQLAKKKK